jgi:hypothetical protein
MRLAHQLVTFSSKLLLRSFYTAHKAHDEAAKSSSAGHLVHSSYHTLDIEACMHDTCYSLSLSLRSLSRATPAAHHTSAAPARSALPGPPGTSALQQPVSGHRESATIALPLSHSLTSPRGLVSVSGSVRVRGAPASKPRADARWSLAVCLIPARFAGPWPRHIRQ